MILKEGVRVKTCSGIEGIVVGKFPKHDGPATGWYYYVKDVKDGTVIPFHSNLIIEVIGEQ